MFLEVIVEILVMFYSASLIDHPLCCSQCTRVWDLINEQSAGSGLLTASAAAWQGFCAWVACVAYVRVITVCYHVPLRASTCSSR